MAAQPTHAAVSGRRFAFALLSWCFASLAVGSSFFFALIPLGSNVGADAGPKGISAYVYPMPLLAWVCLAAMTRSWLKNQPCHWVWLVIGASTGFVSTVIFLPLFFFYISAVPLALYPTFWHAIRLWPASLKAEQHE
ncbi:hypothetical protein [Paracidovorax wautersii]|uniref:hypothetical protein n=1 Tax=Paracidovorax wautersii TaxID=1177982 RepID=UPI0011135B5D|nr:hypothetical protein [Paracidovorax wautersii]